MGAGDATRERGVLGVSNGFFKFFDGRPALGRFFVAGEDAIPVGANVAVLSFDLWSAELARGM